MSVQHATAEHNQTHPKSVHVFLNMKKIKMVCAIQACSTLQQASTYMILCRYTHAFQHVISLVDRRSMQHFLYLLSCNSHVSAPNAACPNPQAQTKCSTSSTSLCTEEMSQRKHHAQRRWHGCRLDQARHVGQTLHKGQGRICHAAHVLVGFA